MPKFTGRLMRHISVLALVAIVWAIVPAPVSIADHDHSGGRRRERCFMVCTIHKMTCYFKCFIQCRNMFRDDDSAQAACRAQCQTICDEDKEECDAKCETIEPPPSPDDPDDDEDGNHGRGNGEP